MRELAPGVHQLRGVPRDAINVYLLGDVIVDAATRWAPRRILGQVHGRPVSAHALTHAHPDHQGASRAICEALRIPLWCGDADAHAMETAPEGVAALQEPGIRNTLQRWLWTGPAHPVARPLREGDEVAGFEVLHVPGHSPGHVAYWRDRDRVLVLGDVAANLDERRPWRVGLHEPLPVFTPDPARNRESIRRLAALEPELCLFGHGPPLRDPGAFARFADGLA